MLRIDSGIDLLAGFEHLSTAVIDASSLIYMKKADFLDLTLAHIQMHSTDTVYNQTGLPPLPVILHNYEMHQSYSADQQLVYLAQSLQIPVISEDKWILKKTAGLGLPYYNTLMILNFLLYKKHIDELNFTLRMQTILSIARYSQTVVRYGAMVTEQIMLKPEIRS